MRTRSTTPLKSLSEPMGRWIGNGGAAEERLDAFERALEAGAFAVELVDHDGAREA